MKKIRLVKYIKDHIIYYKPVDSFNVAIFKHCSNGLDEIDTDIFNNNFESILFYHNLYSEIDYYLISFQIKNMFDKINENVDDFYATEMETIIKIKDRFDKAPTNLSDNDIYYMIHMFNAMNIDIFKEKNK